MTGEREIEHEPQSFSDLPLQPTGSGVQDLEVAYEQMKLAADEDGAASTGSHETARFEGIGHDTATQAQEIDAAAESAAHPS